MSYQTYSLTRVLDGDRSEFAQSFTTSDDDAINCAHMLAAGFNTMSRKMMGDFVLAVVDTKAGTVQYDGKIEKIERPDPHTMSTSFKFEASTDADTMVTIFDNENGRLMFPGKLKFAGEPDSDTLRLARSVLEAAYNELEDVKSVLFDAGVETIPADAGVKDLSTVLFARDEKIAELYSDLNKLAQECEELRKRDEFERHARQSMEAQHAQANETARAEMISFVKRAHAKKVKLQTAVPDGDGRPELDDRWRGMLDVLSKFLVVTGEADADEGHAVARRLCGISDE
jgi:hypothetical protein